MNEFELNIELLKQIVNDWSGQGASYVIIGEDNNSHLRRDNRFDEIFRKFVSQTNSTPLNLLNVQKVNYTYNNGDYYANIDNLLIKDNCDNCYIDSIQCNIIDDVTNVSDHKSINVNVLYKELAYNDNTGETVKKQQLHKILPDLEDEVTCLKFKDIIKLNLCDPKDLCVNDTDKTEIIYNNLTKTIINTFESLIEYKQKKVKKVSWWTKEMKDIKRIYLR